MICLVTGASGFLGGYIAENLARSGHTVLAAVRGTSDCSRLTSLGSNVEILSSEAQIIECTRTRKDITAILHAATDYGRRNEPLSEIIIANVMYPLRIFEANLRGSRAAFLNFDTYFRKSTDYSYLSNYVYSKNLFRNLLGENFRSSEVSIINVVLEHVYGPRDSDSKFTTKLIKDLLVNRQVIEMTAGEQIRDFVHVRDVVEAVDRILVSDEFMNSSRYLEIDIGTGQGNTVRFFAEQARILTGSTSELQFGRLPYRKNEIMASCANTSALRNLGWKPSFDLQSGIISCIEYLRNRDPIRKEAI